jgi:hypothetical protein
MAEMAEIEPSFLSGRRTGAPEGEFFEDARIEALMSAFSEAERACGLRFDRSMPLKERCDVILRAARRGNLDPRVYAIIKFVKKTAK